jgi:hypothetical protein
MTLKQALATLEANDIAAEGTFMFEFHERSRFDKLKFWALYDALAVISDAAPKMRGADAAQHSLHIYQYVLRSIIFHYHPNDGHALRSLPRSDLFAYLDRLEWVFTPIINRQHGYGPANFDDGLERPSPPRRKRRGSRRKA